MKLCINKITSISSGYTFRSKIKNLIDGTVGIIQLSSLSEDYTSIEYDGLIRVSEQDIPNKYILSGYEVLFVAKGNKNNAMAVEKSGKQKLAASATFFILEPDLDIITSEFLAWSLNQPAAQSYLDSIRTGTSTQNINKKALAELEISVPAIDKQKQIVHLARLLKKETTLRQQLIEKRTAYLTSILNQYSNE